MQRRPAPCRHGALAAAVPRGGLETLVCGRYVWASVRFSLWLYVSLGLQLGDLALETRDLELLRLHLAVARKRMFRIVGELLHPIAQLRHMHAQVLRSLHIGHPSILDQTHSLKLELAGKLPSLHDPPPAPSKHLTRCLRNQVQATSRSPVHAPDRHW